MLLLSQTLFIVIALLGDYVYWVRPVLRSRPLAPVVLRAD